MIKRIFYFNITYACDSNCVFCYSHNTKHDSKPRGEIRAEDFKKYLTDNSAALDDRVILNGGEPLLHSEINEILRFLNELGCETVIFTNGRKMRNLDFAFLCDNFRFVVPVHGRESSHDEITRVRGSFSETLRSMEYFVNRKAAGNSLDLKVILNSKMAESAEAFYKTIRELKKIPFDNALHITSMAETIVSQKNGYFKMDKALERRLTYDLFNFLSEDNRPVKVFDSCVGSFASLSEATVKKYDRKIVVFAKDFSHEEKITLSKNSCPSEDGCQNRDFCLSSALEYKVLEFYKGKVYENLE
jgi:MoaA/NifB/PqqE/SkfB family radical SAM enzyme